jgi:hypothetical protein
MLALKVVITRFTSNDNPGFAEATFKDAWGQEIIFHEKIPIFTKDDLDENTQYPQPGVIACNPVKKFIDKDGRLIVTVNTDEPWGVESIDGIKQFNILPEQLTEI